MTNFEINQKLNALTEACSRKELLLIENDGEITEEIDALDEFVSDIVATLKTEAADSLGSWLQIKQSEKEVRKAQKEFAARQMDQCDNTIEFIKAQLNIVMQTAGEDKIKTPLGYSFTRYDKETTEVNKEMLKELYQNKAQEAIAAAGIPDYIGVTLTASATKAKEATDVVEGLFTTTTRPTVKFLKPRAAKES